MPNTSCVTWTQTNCELECSSQGGRREEGKHDGQIGQIGHLEGEQNPKDYTMSLR